MTFRPQMTIITSNGGHIDLFECQPSIWKWSRTLWTVNIHMHEQRHERNNHDKSRSCKLIVVKKTMNCHYRSTSFVLKTGIPSAFISVFSQASIACLKKLSFTYTLSTMAFGTGAQPYVQTGEIKVPKLVRKWFERWMRN